MNVLCPIRASLPLLGMSSIHWSAYLVRFPKLVPLRIFPEYAGTLRRARGDNATRHRQSFVFGDECSRVRYSFPSVITQIPNQLSGW